MNRYLSLIGMFVLVFAIVGVSANSFVSTNPNKPIKETISPPNEIAPEPISDKPAKPNDFSICAVSGCNPEEPDEPVEPIAPHQPSQGSFDGGSSTHCSKWSESDGYFQTRDCEKGVREWTEYNFVGTVYKYFNNQLLSVKTGELK